MGDDFYYTQYGQIKDDSRSNETYNHYESWAMTVRNTQNAREQLTSSDWYFLGFNGTEPLYNNTPGAYNYLNREEQTREYAWFTQDNLCSLIEDRFDRSSPTQGTIEIAIWRDFSTSWSDIALKIGQTYEVIMGYRVYPSDVATSTVARGTSESFTISLSGAFYSHV